MPLNSDWSVFWTHELGPGQAEVGARLLLGEK